MFRLYQSQSVALVGVLWLNINISVLWLNINISVLWLNINIGVMA